MTSFSCNDLIDRLEETEPFGDGDYQTLFYLIDCEAEYRDGEERGQVFAFLISRAASLSAIAHCVVAQLKTIRDLSEDGMVASGMPLPKLPASTVRA